MRKISDIEEKDLWPDPYYTKYLRTGENPGERMQAAFKEVFLNAYEKVLIIWSYYADATSQIIERTFHLLNDRQLIIGPSGGVFHLRVMAAYHLSFFEDKSWSSSSVLDDTIRQTETASLSYELLPELNDINTAKQLK